MDVVEVLNEEELAIVLRRLNTFQNAIRQRDDMVAFERHSRRLGFGMTNAAEARTPKELKGLRTAGTVIDRPLTETANTALT